MAIQFIIDSASDILPAEAKEYGIIHLPLTILFNSEEFRDAIDLTHAEFYDKLIESEVLPTTCQIPPAVFEEAYKKVTDDGDEAIVITLSSKLSGTYQSAVIAADGYDNIHIVDSENISLGERILIQRALEMREEGYSAMEIVIALNIEKKQIRLMALLDTLEYLKKGGRISSATALAGAVLGIKPVIAIEDGAVSVVGKARGSKQGNNLLRELVIKCGGIDFNKPLCLAYSGLSDKMLQKYIVDSEELWKGNADALRVATVGCAIGTHAGPGAIAVAFFEK